ncbi:MAG: DUF5011 domain-containing protein [Vallitalea sp.]|nr:DUF5011 domain-containing protein [Vallitalea sp.]
MIKKTSKVLILTILMGLLFSTTVAYAESWKISGSNMNEWGEPNQIKYFDKDEDIRDNAVYWLDKETFNQLFNYIKKGYGIRYYISFEYKIRKDNISMIPEPNNRWIDAFTTEMGYKRYGFKGISSEFTKLYYTKNGLKDSFDYVDCFEDESLDNRFSLIIKSSECGYGTYTDVKNGYFNFYLIDEIPPNIVSVKYYNDVNLTSEITGRTNLSFNGNQNEVYMAVEFDEEVTVNDTNNKFIRTSRTLMDKDTKMATEKGSFKYEKVDKNKVVFKFQVDYGNMGQLYLIDKTSFLQDIDSFKIKDKNGNDANSSARPLKQQYNDGKSYKIMVDGNPPEITEVKYNVIKLDKNCPENKKQYLTTGDILDIRLKIDSSASVNTNSFFEFNNSERATFDQFKDNWIVYKYTVKKDDANTNELTYKNLSNSIKNLGIKDDFGNIGQMKNDFIFPSVKYNSKKIFVDTTAPRIEFFKGTNYYTTYSNKHVFKLQAVEKGSMSDKGEFYYVINKSSKYPTTDPYEEKCLGRKAYGYSENGGIIDIVIDDNLYLDKQQSEYTQYDQKYDEINMTGKHKNVNYVDGTASDVIYDGRREITGIFYIHTYIKDKAGNITRETSQPIHMDNTHAKIKMAPNGTSNTYVGDIDVDFELLEEELSGFKKYEYRWVSPIDLDGKKLNKKDMYNKETDTYKLLTENTSWIVGNALNSYSKSKIPIPPREQRQHGASYLLIRAFDNTDNISYIVSEPYYFDKVSPIVTFKSESGGFDKPLKNHKIKVTIDDKDSELMEYKYYFSNSNLPRELDDKIWKYLDLKLPDLPDDYNPIGDYKNNELTNENDEDELLIKQAIVETDVWNKETANKEPLNGFVFLHIYAKDSSGNEIIKRQDMKIDNGGIPMISFDYDNAIGNRYKSVIGHINCSDDGGIKTLEYKWSQTKDVPQEYKTIDISKFDDKSNIKVNTDQFNQAGEWYLHVRATDVYGNVKNSVSEKYIINSTAPNITLFQIDNNTVYLSKEKNIAITINKTNDDKLEYTYVVYSNSACDNEIKRGTFSTTSEIVNIQLDENSNDIQEYYFKFYDSLNQVTEDSTKVQVVYDNTPPTADLIYSPNKEEVTSNNVTVTLDNISDNVSGKEDITVSETEHTFTENGEHIFALTDKAGNKRTYVARVTWIKDDKPIVRVTTNNVYGQSYKSLSFDLSAQRPIESGYINIVDPEIYYQFSKTENIEDKNFIKYKNGETISLSDETGEYYLHTKLVDGGRSFTKMYGKYIIDNTLNEPSLTYTYVNSEGTKVECLEDEYKALKDVSSIVKVALEFDEDIVIKSVINNGGENLPCVNQVTFYNNDTITVTYTDKAGNEDSKEIAISNIKRDDSIITITPNKATNSEVKVLITAPSDKRINNIRVDDWQIDPTDINSVITTKADSEDNYLTIEFTVLNNCNIKVDIFDKDNKDTVVATQEYNVTNIDKTAPVGIVEVKDIDKYTKTSSIKITDENPTKVTKVEFIKEDNSKVNFDITNNYTSEDIIYNHITNSVTTKINGTVKYYFEDSAGNKGEAQESINTINTNLDISKVKATYKVGDKTYKDVASIGKVNKDVEVTINVPEGYYIVNNSGKNKRLFVVGMEYDFLISNGINIDKFNVDLTNTIKKSGPKLKLNYTIGDKPYKDQLVNGKTSQNVLLTITSDDDISKVVFDSEEDTEKPYTYEFNENKIINIIATDVMGNTTILKTSIDCIDKDPVRASLFSLYTKPTKDDIKLQFLATKEVNILEVKKDGKIIKQEVNIKKDKYEFIVKDNGTYSVKYRDDIGNEKTVSLEVNNIDRIAPNIKLLYNGKETMPVTNDSVMVSVKLVNENQEPYGIKVLNTIGNTNSYLFKENGKFTFRVSDMAGNITEKDAIINSIDRDPVSYTVTYSETNFTKNNVIATVAIDEKEKNYKILNSDIDQDNIENSVNKKVKIEGNKIKVTFDDNGYYLLYVSDEAGNKSTILLRVRNIDRIKPTLKFKKDYVVTKKGVMPKLDDVIAYDTHDGDIKEKVNITPLDISTEGDQEITYTVSDRAGNTVSLKRVVKVVSDVNYTVVVDGKINPKPYRSTNEETDIKVFNFVENTTIKYIKGIVKDGEFKQNGQVYSKLLDTIDDSKLGNEEVKLSLDKLGWYTIYIIDLNRQKASFSVYFTK